MSGGAKNYSFTTSQGKVKTVCKGFALSYDNKQRLGHDEMKKIVFGDLPSVDFTFSAIKIDKTHRVMTKEAVKGKPTKRYKFVYDKRVVSEFNMESKCIETYPFGYHGKA